MKRVDVAYVLLFDEQHEKVLMVKNKGANSSYYTLPGGAVEAGETLEEAAIREVKEETGVDIEIGGLSTVSEAFFEERGHHALFFTFTGKIVGGKIEILFPDEIEEIKWMEIDEAETYMYIPEKLNGYVKTNISIPYILRGNVIDKG
ncbi:NUDIX hydrolase [Gracilibacillus alcaliphilus]|uniref:NUDIX hydrolase n=1 Tax=Gracilibacillus alcaliphilus TaxID=1401441 RepID=UPI001957C199|nr:NUDIX hydrolase [Gracilibacillus alcaliphilus]MBM7677851.1 8-oxo-dGTP diphosphatase [Gracilibacillus alcaliphilus]